MLDGFNGSVRSREHTKRRTIDRRDGHAVAAISLHLRLRKAHREHRTSGLRLHELRSLGD